MAGAACDHMGQLLRCAPAAKVSASHKWGAGARSGRARGRRTLSSVLPDSACLVGCPGPGRRAGPGKAAAGRLAPVPQGLPQATPGLRRTPPSRGSFFLCIYFFEGLA